MIRVNIDQVQSYKPAFEGPRNKIIFWSSFKPQRVGQ